MIHAKDLVKKFGETVAVDSVSFDVAAGRVVGFLGPNGAGKTTTLRMLTCFMPATSGTATVAGFDVHDASLAVRRNVGYLPENVPLPGEMRTVEYLHYRARLKGLVGRAARRRHINELLDRCGVVEVRRKPCSQLSKGYRQRVGLADALIGDPKVLFLDEPTIGLDPNQIRDTRTLIRDLGRSHTVMVSTHVLPEVEMICDDVIIIHNGRIAASGPTRELREKHVGGNRLYLEVEGPREAVERALSQIEGVASVSRRAEDPETVYRLELTGEDDLRAEISRRIAAGGWLVLELRRRAATLEDIFVDITMREG